MTEHTPPTEHDAPQCESGWCSTSLMKAGCPSCLLVGLVIWPFESLVRGARKLFAKQNP